MPEHEGTQANDPNYFRRKAEVLARNLENKQVKLLDIVSADVRKELASLSVEELTNTIAEQLKVDQSMIKQFDLSSQEGLTDATAAIADTSTRNLLLIRYPHFAADQDGGHRSDVLDFYYNMQSWYFHMSEARPTQSVIVQLYDDSLKDALNEVGAIDTLTKVSYTPHIDISSLED